MPRKVNKNNNLPNEEEVSQYEMLVPLLEKLQTELKELSKKKQDGQLNELKVNMVNRVLTQIKNFLQNEPTAEFLDLLDNETLPSNSDAVLILSQFDAALLAFREKYYGYDSDEGENRWFTKENPKPNED